MGHRLQPNYHPIIFPTVYQDKHILVLWAVAGQTRPYKAPVSLSAKNKGYRYYIRKGSVTVAAKDHDEREFLEMAATVPFDDRINHSAGIGDLDLGLIRSYLQQVKNALFQDAGKMNFLQLCRSMNLVGGPNEQVRPKNVALMLFNPDPQQYFPRTQIDIADFPEGLDADIFTEKIFKGPVHIMLKDALAHLESQVIKERVHKFANGPLAERAYNYSYSALKEALCNAVYHRSYQTRESIEVRVLPDSIVIHSFPGPDRSIPMKDVKALKLVARRYRNSRVGEFLKELDLTEGRGTGIPKMIRALKRNGSPMPVFHTDKDRTYLTIEFPIHPAFLGDIETQGLDKVGERVGEKVGEKLSSNQRKILGAIAQDRSIAAQGLAEIVGISPRKIEENIAKLKALAILKRVGPDKGGHWEVIKPKDSNE